ncbi:MAG: flagellar hook capping FlgD N-terminal domain-containing protein [Clostridia bacterium]|jgi:flagellar basal-body rod modification protein FlgD
MNIVPIDETTKYVNETKAKDSTTLDQEDFLSILVSQMQNQNPMEPMNDFEYMSQITQFSMLDSVNGISSKLGGMSALDYIGKTIIGTYMTEGSTETRYTEGLVQSITIQDDTIMLNLDNESIYMENVLHVY